MSSDAPSLELKTIMIFKDGDFTWLDDGGSVDFAEVETVNVLPFLDRLSPEELDRCLAGDYTPLNVVLREAGVLGYDRRIPAFGDNIDKVAAYLGG